MLRVNSNLGLRAICSQFGNSGRTLCCRKYSLNLLSPKFFSSESTENLKFDTLAVSKPADFVYHVELNRPNNLNSFNNVMWREIGECFAALATSMDCRSIVVSAKGKLFTAGIDFSDLTQVASVVTGDQDISRKCRIVKEIIYKYQNSLSSLELCPKPVIAAVHGGCIGAGVDLICSADIRYCSTDAWFQVKEVDVGLAADVGTLQRLPKIVGSESLVRDLCFTARKMYSAEANKSGLVSRILPDHPTLLSAALETAKLIAEKSPVAVQTTKEALVHARDYPVQEGLERLAVINSTLLQSQDLMTAAFATMNKEKPKFPKY